MPHRGYKFLEDIRAAIQRVREFIKGRSQSEYEVNEFLQSAVERQLEIIGEALNRARREDETLMDHISDGHRIIGLRNLLIHGYDIIDHSVVWAIVSNKLDLLDREIHALMDEYW